jgi:hypothetical protein
MRDKLAKLVLEVCAHEAVSALWYCNPEERGMSEHGIALLDHTLLATDPCLRKDMLAHPLIKVPLIYAAGLWALQKIILLALHVVAKAAYARDSTKWVPQQVGCCRHNGWRSTHSCCIATGWHNLLLRFSLPASEGGPQGPCKREP